MQLDEARAVLGVRADAGWPAIRATYLRLVRDHHPDNAGDAAEAGLRTVRTAQITEAFAVLAEVQAAAAEHAVIEDVASAMRRDAEAAPIRDVGLRRSAAGPDDVREVLLDASLTEAFLALHEAFSVLGAVSYLDRLSLVLETIVTTEPGRATSLLAWLEPGPDGATQVIVGVESLGGHAPADLDHLVDELAALLAAPRPPVASA